MTKAEQTIVIQKKFIGDCECTEFSTPSSAKVAYSLAEEAITEDYKGHYRRAIKLYRKCRLSMKHSMKNDVKCDVLMGAFREMNKLYGLRVERLKLHVEKTREMKRRIAEEKRRIEKLRELQYEYCN